MIDFLVTGPDAANYPRAMFFKCAGTTQVRYVLAERLRIVLGRQPPDDVLRVYDLCKKTRNSSETEWERLRLNDTLDGCMVQDHDELKVMDARHVGLHKQDYLGLERRIAYLQNKLDLQKEAQQWAERKWEEKLADKQQEVDEWRKKCDEFYSLQRKGRLEMDKLR